MQQRRNQKKPLIIVIISVAVVLVAAVLIVIFNRDNIFSSKVKVAARYAKSINTQLNLSNSYILSDVIYLDVDAHGTDGIGRIEIYQFKYKSTVSSNDKLRDVYVIDGKIYVNEQIGNYSKDDLTKYAVAAVIAVMGYEYPEFSDDDVKIIKSERLSVQEVLSKM